MAFSRSSASRWLRSSAANPAICACGGSDGDADALVPLDLADGRADDVDERDGTRVPLAVFGAGEDEEVLAVAAHDGGEVVELEERGEPFGVLLALLQALDDGELALDEAEGAQREVDEGAVDAVPDPLQVGGGVGEFGAQPVAFVGHGLAAADEVLAVAFQGHEPLVEGEGVRVEREGVRVERVDGAYDLGELVVAAGEPDRFLGLRVGGERGPSRSAGRPAGG